jgi:hypothetical protein
MKEPDLKHPEERDGDPRKKRFQVGTGTSEPKPVKVRKCDPRHNRCSQQLSLDIAAGLIAIKANRQYLQLGHKGKPLE